LKSGSMITAEKISLFLLDGDMDNPIQELKEKYDKNAEEFWEGLSEVDKFNAFYAVIRRVCQAELVDQGSFRHSIYDVFGFDTWAYAPSMFCGYLELHNALCSAVEGVNEDDKEDTNTNTGSDT